MGGCIDCITIFLCAIAIDQTISQFISNVFTSILVVGFANPKFFNHFG
jgi:hypothetical protein